MGRRAPRGIALSVAALTCFGCDPPTLPERPYPDVLVVTVDGLRADLLRCYGNQGENAPQIDAFAGRATVFAQAYAPAWQSAPALASLWTGLHPLTHDVSKQGATLAEEHVTVAERLKTEGVLTGAIQSDGALSETRGFAQGFEVYDELVARSHVERGDTSPGTVFPLVTQAARAWLAERTADAEDPPWFLWLHYASPVPDWPWAELEESPFEVMSAADTAVGTLIETLEASAALASTIVVLAGSDGGEDASTLPLLVYLPQTIPHTVTTPVSVVDLHPTLLELFSLETDAESSPLEGSSLVRALLDLDLDRGPLLARGETFATVIAREWRLDVDRNGLWRRLHHVQNDPGRTLNLANEIPIEAQRLAAELAELERGNFAGPQDPGSQ